MKRYFGEESDDEEQYFDDEDNLYEGADYDPEHDGQIAYMDSNDLVEMMHMDLAQTELNQHLLGKAIDLAQQSFFWRFKSTPSKLKEIKKNLQTTHHDDR